MFVVGTAGHVDHGKSSFLRALTGMEPDRLPDEKKKGMTIDLNFVWWERPNGEVLGVVDVPGHHRFVKNMISGVMNINAYLFIVAADDGWMPQSEEHLQVLKAMGVRCGIAIVTKVDLVTEERAQEVKSIVQKKIEAALGQTPEVCFFSAVEPNTLPQIKEGLEKLLLALPSNQDVGSARLWVDRIFVPKGKGVVVTGTLREGQLKVGDELAVLPQKGTATVKGLQSYKHNLEVAEPVSRVAVQLAKVDHRDLSRGTLLQKGRDIPLCERFDACMEFFFPFKGESVEWVLFLGTAKRSVLVVPLKALEEGKRYWVRLKLKSPLPIRVGERFLLRTPGEERNAAAGIVMESVLDGGSHKEALKRLAAWKEGPEGFVHQSARRTLVVSTKELWDRSVYPLGGLEQILASEAFCSLGNGKYANRVEWEKAQKLTLDVFKKAQSVQKDTLSENDVHTHFRKSKLLPLVALPSLLSALVDSKKLQRAAQGYQLAGAGQSLTPQEKQAWALLEKSLERATTLAISLKEMGGELREWRRTSERLEKSGYIVRLGEDQVLRAESYQGLKAQIKAHLTQKEKATTSELKGILNTSRKYAVLLLERMDKDRLTYLKGGVRYLFK